MVQPHQIHAQAPQPLGNSIGVFRLWKISAKRQIHSEESNSSASGRHEPAIGGSHFIGIRQWRVQKTEISRARYVVLIHGEAVEIFLRICQ